MLADRPTWDQYFIKLLAGLSLRGTCPRRQCSALIVDEHFNLISTGYNGPPSGLTNCNETPCPGVMDQKGDTSNCWALHAEHNAIYHAGDRKDRAYILYCTNLPCFKCALEICQTPIKRVVYLDDYSDHRCEELFKLRGISLSKGVLDAR